MQSYEKPDVEKIFLRPKKDIIAGGEYAESIWSGKSCFAICRIKARGRQPNDKKSSFCPNVQPFQGSTIRFDC